MSEYIIGIDPDAGEKGHGVAVYRSGELVNLKNLTLLELQGFLFDGVDSKYSNVEIHMEDNVMVSAAYRAQAKQGSLAVKLKMAQHIGMLKQAQIELERMFYACGIKLVKRKPASQWKKGTDDFKRATGWTGRSNEDTRSAAYFGYLGVRDSKLIKREAK